MNAYRPSGLHSLTSGIISSSELADLQREMGEDQYQQEFECSFEAAIKGAFYADEMRTMLAEGRIRPIEIEKENHYAQVLHDKRIQQGWKYGDHYFPHDITVRELSSGISRVQSLAASGNRSDRCTSVQCSGRY
jgi:phage terminase large subunit